MKKYFTFPFCVLVTAFALIVNIAHSQQVIITDDADYITPVEGAVLDIKSTSRGVVIPRVANTAAVTTPQNGMLVYSNATNSFWTYQNNSWHEQTTASESGTVNLGGSSNNFSVNSDGTVTLNGNATAWNDLLVNPATARNNGNTSPDWSTFLTPNLNTWFFANSADQEVCFSVQLPHDYKEGSTIYPHIHWSSTTAAGTSRVMWKLDYQWVNLGDQFTASTSTTLSGYEVVGGSSESLVAYEHAITNLGENGISGTGKKISSILMCRLYRAGSDGSDTFTGAAALLSIDFHYEIDSFGSNLPFTK